MVCALDIRQPPPSGRPATDALIDGAVWDRTALSFSFPTAGQYTGYAAGEEPSVNFEAFNATQQAAVVAILTSISNFANLTFHQIAGATAGTAVLRFGMSDGTDVAHPYLPHDSDVGGDAWFHNTGGTFDNRVRGGYAWYTIVPEIGHALGSSIHTNPCRR
jgi:serralysin